jgi:hypothetical protein
MALLQSSESLFLGQGPVELSRDEALKSHVKKIHTPLKSIVQLFLIQKSRYVLRSIQHQPRDGM